MKKRNLRERERERENVFCVEKLCIKCNRELQIYSKMMDIRKARNKGRYIKG